MLVKNKNINQSIVIGSKTYKLLGEYIELRNKQSIFIRNLFPPLKATIILYHLLVNLSNFTFLLFSR